MKNNLLRNTILVGVLCTALAVPAFALSTKAPSVSTEDIKPIPISYRPAHWAQPSLEQLAKSYDVEPLFTAKDLDAAAAVQEFQKLVRLVLDKEYDSAPDKMTREAVVYELTKIWAAKTGQDLDSIPVIEMLIYKDTGDMDPKYNHAVTVAYMKNIAKGKGPGAFDPKAHVTYGELAALINNTDKAITQELHAQGQAIAKGKFETKVSYEIKDGQVIFDFELLSHYTKLQQLQFGSGQQFELTITDEKGQEVYRYSDGKFFTLALLLKNINPGEALKWQTAWDMTGKEGEKLTSGKYQAEINILVIPEDNEERIDASELTTVIDFSLGELTEEGLIKPVLAKEIIAETADKLIHAIGAKDAATIADYIHPVKGVRFTPYTNVSPERDVVFQQKEMKNFFQDQEVYLWGYYDGTGDEIALTPSAYYKKFIYSADFINAEKIGYNEVLSSGNMLENQFKAYQNAIVAEYYFPGFNPDYAGLDWQSLRLVFEQYEDSWKLVGIIHNQWTI